MAHDHDTSEAERLFEALSVMARTISSKETEDNPYMDVNVRVGRSFLTRNGLVVRISIEEWDDEDLINGFGLTKEEYERHGIEPKEEVS